MNENNDLTRVDLPELSIPARLKVQWTIPVKQRLIAPLIYIIPLAYPVGAFILSHWILKEPISIQVLFTLLWGFIGVYLYLPSMKQKKRKNYQIMLNTLKNKQFESVNVDFKDLYRYQEEQTELANYQDLIEENKRLSIKLETAFTENRKVMGLE
ncbi:MAG: hypothetical protein LBV67_01975 [Streptococcaceae bacterium]|jgi:hypothetical protein|nr:hypothetical protein [Streptococcaceae bacterium]